MFLELPALSHRSIRVMQKLGVLSREMDPDFFASSRS